jgi:hypothetical protein
MRLRLFTLVKDLKKKGKKKKLASSMAKWPLLGGTQIGGVGSMVVGSLIIPLTMEDNTTCAADNGRTTFQATTCFIGHNFGTRLGPGKKPRSCSQFGIK